MRRLAQFSSCALLFVLLLAGCALPLPQTSTIHPATPGPTATATPIPTPAGLLVFSETGSRIFNSKTNTMTQHFATALYDLNPQTGAVLWKTPAYSGQPVQTPVIMGARAIFAIGANITFNLATNGASIYSGTVHIYSADLNTGAVTSVGALSHVESYGQYQLLLGKVSDTTIIVSYAVYQTATTFTDHVLAFTTSLDSPSWQFTVPANTFLFSPYAADGDINMLAYRSANKSLSLMAFNMTDGSTLHTITLATSKYVQGDVIADGMLITSFASASPSQTTTLEQELDAYSLKDGSLVWKHKASGTQIEVEGAVNGLVFYYTSASNKSYLVAAHTSDGSQAWSKAIPGFGLLSNSATHVYVTYFGQKSRVDSIDGATGKILWTHSWPTSQSLQTGLTQPADDDNNAYIGVSHWNQNNNVVSPSTLYALSATSGAIAWSRAIPGQTMYPESTSNPATLP